MKGKSLFYQLRYWWHRWTGAGKWQFRFTYSQEMSSFYMYNTAKREAEYNKSPLYYDPAGIWLSKRTTRMNKSKVKEIFVG